MASRPRLAVPHRRGDWRHPGKDRRQPAV